MSGHIATADQGEVDFYDPTNVGTKIAHVKVISYQCPDVLQKPLCYESTNSVIGVRLRS
jgi:hypothetical protein